MVETELHFGVLDVLMYAGAKLHLKVEVFAVGGVEHLWCLVGISHLSRAGVHGQHAFDFGVEVEFEEDVVVVVDALVG